MILQNHIYAETQPNAINQNINRPSACKLDFI